MSLLDLAHDAVSTLRAHRRHVCPCQTRCSSSKTLFQLRQREHRPAVRVANERAFLAQLEYRATNMWVSKHLVARPFFLFPATADLLERVADLLMG
jgi:hypothetical protein